jgi:hypothetical protein
MNTKLNVKQWAIASLAVFVIIVIFTILQAKVILPQPMSTEPQSTAQTDAGLGRILVYLARLIGAGLFTFIFTKGYEGKPGLGEGVRYGLWIGLFLLLPGYLMGLEYSGLPLSTSTISLLVGLIQNVLCGAVVAQLYKPSKA